MRLCIFSHFDPNNTVDEYVFAQLSAIQKANFKIIFVSTSAKLEAASTNALEEMNIEFHIRQNTGFDYGSYAFGIEQIPNLSKLECLLLTNDSQYGPFEDSYVSKAVEAAITGGFDLFGLTDSYDRTYHVQGYFLLYSSRLIRSEAFRNFWTEYTAASTSSLDIKRYIIEKYEVGGCSAFISAGFKVGALHNVKELEAIVSDRISSNFYNETTASMLSNVINSGNVNQTHFFWRELIEVKGFAYIKRDLITRNPSHADISGWENVVKAASRKGWLGKIERHIERYNKYQSKSQLSFFFENITTDRGLEIPYFIHRCLDVWPDLADKFGVGSENITQLCNSIAVWEKTLKHRSPDVRWPARSEYPSYLFEEDPFLEQDMPIRLTRGMNAILNTRSDLRNNFDISSKLGRLRFVNWVICDGWQEYYFLHLDKESIKYLLSEKKLNANSSIDAVPKIVDLAVCHHTDPHLIEGSLNDDENIVKNNWRLFEDFYNEKLRAAAKQKVQCRDTSNLNHFDISSLKKYAAVPVTISGTPLTFNGIGEDAYQIYSALKSVGVQTALEHLDFLGDRHREDLEILDADELSKIVIRATPLQATIKAFFNGRSRDYLGRHNIGLSQWELETFPNYWQPIAEIYDEFWAISDFVADGLRALTDRPVNKITLPVSVDHFQRRNRQYFGFPEDAYLFLIMFDCNSYVSRKNPLAAVEAFEAAFSERQDVGLVIKVSNNNLEDVTLQSLLARLRAKGNVFLILESLDRQDVLALIDQVNSVISLHRSEGFGRILAEAMLLGKPVVASNYSGNLDFMSEQNSFLVDGDLVDVPRGAYVGLDGQKWFNPSNDLAIDILRFIHSNQAIAEQKGVLAKEFIQKHYSLKKCGFEYKLLLSNL